ncbi:ROK family protein [Homoserinibacter sp. YIM 151385]|uniref:ROK family protein n=1 Tax=Homoserinibacter sp. YIM 151385 TaxID=2985506 RepID=UPI0022F0B5A4|nr:ROK family protein [Homoserinibacter sp. YIM 151385]WBU38754.1 ROK family protein [Homoserinibacter sp. YIM 151385]
MHAIGIDIGGTKIAGAVVTELGEILAEDRRPTPAGDPDAIVDAVVDMIRGLEARHPVRAAGVAAPGFIDAAQSTVYYTPNIAWRNEPVQRRLAALLPHLDITIDNDANAAGWAEFRFGAGRMSSDMTMLTIGTGVGGAVVVGDRLLRGGFGSAGEIGHLRVVPNGLPCGCGARGCIEQYGSGRALLRMAGEIADAGGIGQALAAAREERGGRLDGDAVGGLIVQEDPGALAALRELGGWLGQACASLSAVLDPQIFVFGGGVAAAGERLLHPVRESYLAHLPARGYHPEPVFLVAELVNDAGVVGAADLARIHSGDR